MRGEPNPIVFISSKMDNKFEELREEAKEAVETVLPVIPWTFEHTPASSEPTPDNYLSQVRESVFLIWIVGEETTEPVKKEILEAISSNTSLLVFKLPVDSFDDETEQLISRAEPHCKWKQLSDRDDLVDEIEDSIADEVSRLLSNEPSLGRLKQLELKLNKSRARSIARWQSTGVSKEQAKKFYEDKSIGAPKERLEVQPEQNLVSLIGEQGIGKSLIAERILEKAILQARDDPNAPLPLFLEATEIGSDLQSKVLSELEELGEPRTQGAKVVIDGVDEAVDGKVSELLSQSREIVEAWPNTKIILTSRPLRRLSEIEETITVEPLDGTAALDLINTFGGNEVSEGQSLEWPESLKEAIRIPLFALLMGAYISEQGHVPSSKAKLLDHLVEESLDESPEEGQRELLQKAAVIAVDRGYGEIYKSEVATGSELEPLSNSRLVVESETTVEFPLSIIAQWFAARSLVNDGPSPEDLVSDSKRLDRWFYPLVIFVGTFSHNDVTNFLSPIVQEEPGFVSKLVKKAIEYWPFDESGINQSLPSAKYCGRQVKEVTSIWAKGVGKIANRLFPITDTGDLPPLGVHKGEDRLSTAWYIGDEQLEEVVERPTGELMESPSWTLGATTHSLPSAPAWAWKRVTENIRSRISNLVDNWELEIREKPLMDEANWLMVGCKIKVEHFFSHSISRDIFLSTSRLWKNQLT